MRSPAHFIAVALTLFLAIFSPARAGTLVSIATPVGTMTVELYDAEKPNTVTNFLTYVNSDRYANLFSHRLDPDFVLQSGGFTVVGSTSTPVPTDPPIANEFTADPRFSNTLGTIAMAKVGGDPDSATSQWFINLGDNSFLDSSNGGFTVFGRVVSGLEVLARFNSDFNDSASGGRGVYDVSAQLGPTYTELPLLDGELIVENLVSTAVAIIPPAVPAPDARPTVTVKGKRTLTTTRSRVVIRGRASDDTGVSRVEYKVPGSKYRFARGKDNWKIRTRLDRKRTVVKVRAIDASGQRSLVRRIKVIRR